jgi:geranylgeranyl diphosphate synthase type I
MESIKAHVLALPEVAAWPEMAGFFERKSRPRPDWNSPLLACQAVGGDASLTTPGAAAIACLQVSIILVDDMLDEDPRGEHLRRGSGPTANLALAFQAAAFRVIEQAAVSADRRAAVIASLAWLALATALGQHWDVQNLNGEKNYWKVVRAKSTPFYGAALHVGALLGGASDPVAEGLRDFGVLIGEIIQIRDDLFDAFQTPANPDWKQGRNNLPILFARTADHLDRARFLDLLPRTDDPLALQEAQQILIHCGAVSYCAYHLVKRHREARQLLEGIPLADPAPMMDLLARETQPLVELLRTSGVEIPVDLLVEPPDEREKH